MIINSVKENSGKHNTLNDKFNPIGISNHSIEHKIQGMPGSQISSSNKDNNLNQNIIQINTDNGNSLFNANNTNIEQLTNLPLQNQQIIITKKEIPGNNTIIGKTKYIVNGKEVSEEEMKEILKNNNNYEIITTSPKITTSTTTKTTTITTITKDGKTTTTTTENITTNTNDDKNT